MMRVAGTAGLTGYIGRGSVPSSQQRVEFFEPAKACRAPRTSRKDHLPFSPLDLVVTVKPAASAIVCPPYMKDSELSVAPDSSSSSSAVMPVNLRKPRITTACRRPLPGSVKSKNE
jgi:hypothetical protein